MSQKGSSPSRRSIRLPGYDYSQAGAYFVTIVTYDRKPLFGEVKNDEMHLNALGKIAQDEWFRTSRLRLYVKLLEDEFIVMPNHIHGIIWITDTVGAYRNTPLPTQSFHSPGIGIGAIIRGYKSSVTSINQLRQTPATPIWQRNYYEHIIRNEQEMQSIADYTITNPLNWEKDAENQD